MKKIYSTFILFAVLAFTAQAQTTWDNFEDARKATYGFINGVFIPYTENPDPSGINTSQVVATYSRNPVEQFDVIVMNGQMADVTDYVFGTKQISIDVWSPAAGIEMIISLENEDLAFEAPFPTGRQSRYNAFTTLANQWETLTFDILDQPDGSVGSSNVDQLVLLFNPGNSTGETYFWDNLEGPEFANDPCEGVETDASILNDFECQQNVNYIFSSSGINFRRVENPDMNGNESSFVASYVRNAGEELDVLIGRFDGNLQLNPTSTITMDVWDGAGPGTPVTLSLQTVTNDLILELPAFTTTTEAWETLSWDVSSVSDNPDIGQFVILFDQGAFTSDQYYFDNMTVTGVSSTDNIDVVADLTAFPNPATDQVSIAYNLKSNSDVNITLTDITGRVIENRLLENQSNGSHLVEFNTSRFADGIYLYNVRVANQNQTGKIVVNN